ncbi:MAG: hypothetical protein IKG52_11250 [Rhodobacteraceae bacterium]|nr:hypothetical protein [Paracoccaceae bacterium]
MAEQIALLELALIDASDRKAMSMVHDIGEGTVLGRPAKFRLTCNFSRIEVWVDKRVYTISLRELLEGAQKAIEDEMRAKLQARALAVHGDPQAETELQRAARAWIDGKGVPVYRPVADSSRPVFIGIDMGRDE